jgi:hypothetical protein
MRFRLALGMAVVLVAASCRAIRLADAAEPARIKLVSFGRRQYEALATCSCHCLCSYWHVAEGLGAIPGAYGKHSAS